MNNNNDNDNEEPMSEEERAFAEKLDQSIESAQ